MRHGNGEESGSGHSAPFASDELQLVCWKIRIPQQSSAGRAEEIGLFHSILNGRKNHDPNHTVSRGFYGLPPRNVLGGSSHHSLAHLSHAGSSNHPPCVAEAKIAPQKGRRFDSPVIQTGSFSIAHYRAFDYRYVSHRDTQPTRRDCEDGDDAPDRRRDRPPPARLGRNCALVPPTPT